MLGSLRRFYPVAAFFAGFIWDALTIGQRVRPLDFVRLGGFLAGAALLAWWLARRDARAVLPPSPDAGWRLRLGWQLPYLAVQFFFGGIFSALFILYFKSSGHFGAWLVALLLGSLLVANEFAGERYGRRFTLTWALFAINAILLANFALPYALGSLDPRWFYVSTLAGALLAQACWWLAPGRPGRIAPAWLLAGVLLAAWQAGMIAPVPLVKKELAVGQAFVQRDGDYLLQVEPAPGWQFWRSQASTVNVPPGARLYGLSAVYAPQGLTARLEHRWEYRGPGGWQAMARSRFASSGGRERGFRGYSWVQAPAEGDWRLVVATQDGRTIGILYFQVRQGRPAELVQYRY